MRILSSALASFAFAFAIAIAGCNGSSPRTGDGGTSTGWRSAVGARGVFAQTFDGVTWRSRAVTQGALYSVACVGNWVGWTAGEHGFLAHTLDGGATWTTQDAHVGAALRAVRFGDTMNGVVAGDGGALAVSHDGGAHWTNASVTTSTLRGAAVSGDASMMLVVGDGGVALRSIDGGATWTTATIAGGADLRSAATDPSAHVVLVVDARGGVWASTDRGATFAAERAPASSLESVSIADDGSIALAVGGGTAIVRRSGEWAAAAIPSGLSLHAALVAEGTLVAGGEGGALVASADGGETWASRAIGSDAAIYALDDL
jgi:photosystem II stability/assembly factor-like uncharacterized protein